MYVNVDLLWTNIKQRRTAQIMHCGPGGQDSMRVNILSNESVKQLKALIAKLKPIRVC